MLLVRGVFWWLTTASAGRAIVAALAIVAGLQAVVWRAERRGAAEQVVKQQQVDAKAKARADAARKAAVKRPAVKGKVDEFQRD
jgi:hypothetical protein